jgi:predicted nucleotide-binding protein
MSPELLERLDQFIESGANVMTYSQYDSWITRLRAFLGAIGESDHGSAIVELGSDNMILEWAKSRDAQVSYLDGLTLRMRASVKAEQMATVTAIAAQQLMSPPSNRVFLVHGHDVAAKESLARFLEKLSLAPVILHEQANEGKTVIEKFESHSNVSFAVVLLTPDDVGASATTPSALASRARQNVVLELGYFTGKLGRNRVCALYKPGIEIPSDIHGVLFVELDDPGAWRTKLAQELVSSGMKINLQGLVS